MRYKEGFVTQGFPRRLGIDYEETYSPAIDAIAFRFLVSLSSEWLDTRHMDVVIAYLYGSINKNIYMKILEGLKMTEANNYKPLNLYSLMLQQSLYRLKQFVHKWFNQLSNYSLKERYVDNVICPCVFIKKSKIRFAIVAIYLNHLNLIGTPEELLKTAFCLKNELAILLHQLTYTKKSFKVFLYGLSLSIKYYYSGTIILCGKISISSKRR